MMRTEYIYNDAAGSLLGVITRVDPDIGEKTFYASKGFPKPRPLYGLDLLADRPDAPVLVVEGEKTANAARTLFPDMVVTTSPFGAKSAKAADWSPIVGRRVTIWGDNDKAGIGYVKDVSGLVRGARVVSIGMGFPDGWDLADTLPDGVGPEDLARIIKEAEPTKQTKKAARDALKQTVEDAKRERESVINKILALVSKTVANGCTEEESESAFHKARALMEEHDIREDDLRAGDAEPAPTFDDLGADLDGDAILADVFNFIGRFVSYPSTHARVAHALWIAHTHMMEIWDSTPRIAFMSPERGSGKTRALEATEFWVPRPVHSVNNSVAYVIRKVADDAGAPTILYDEVDSLFSANKSDPSKADLLALLNAGHRKGATSGRCVVGMGGVRTEELPAYAALALAGLRGLPDTIASRSIIIEMRRRAPDEKVEPFRDRIHRAQARPIYDDLEVWCSYSARNFSGQYQDMPAEITDRDADCWEPLLAVADAAGGDWPELARDAAVFLVKRNREIIQTKGVELLEHILEAFEGEDRIWTKTLQDRLFNRDESPWHDQRGEKMTDRALAEKLRPYGIKSRPIRQGDVVGKGYLAADFADSWNRYLSLPQDHPYRGYKGYKGYKVDNNNNNVTDVTPVTPKGEEVCQACDGNFGKGCPTCKPKAYGIG